MNASIEHFVSHPDQSEFYSSETLVIPVGLSRCVNAVLTGSFCSDLEDSGLAVGCILVGDAAHTDLCSLWMWPH